MPVFVAFVAPDAAGAARPGARPLRVAACRRRRARRFAWPRERRALEDAVAAARLGRRRGGGGRAAGMLARRIIPCLDVAGGRVVKGVHFESLRDAGDPVEQAARYDAEGADELVFLDISASPDARRTTLEMVGRVAESIFIPFTVGGGIRSVADAGRRAPGRGGQGLGQHRRGARSVAGLPARRELRQPVRRRRGGREAGGRPVRRDGERRAGGDAARGGRVDPAAGVARRGRDPAHLHGSRRHRARATTSSCSGRRPARCAFR